MDLTPREQEALDVHKSGVSNAAGATMMGIGERAYRRLRASAYRKLEATDMGMDVSSVSETFDDEGNVRSTSVRMSPEKEAFVMPEEYKIAKMTVNRDESGKVKQDWLKLDREAEARQAFLDAIDIRAARIKPIPLIRAPRTLTDNDLLGILPVSDLHMGMYSWAVETGEDFDCDIARDVLINTTSEVVSEMRPCGECVVLVCGDYFHADNDRNQTERSGNPLDVDTRMERVIDVGVDALESAVAMALQKHKTVRLIIKPGNHDNNSARWLRRVMRAVFRENPRVEVDSNPSEHWVYKFGRCLFSAHHGHRRSPEDIAGSLAARHPREWGGTDHRYHFSFHVHHKLMAKSVNGVRWETFEALTAPDGYHAAEAYASGRSMTGLIYHRELGERYRYPVIIPPQQQTELAA